MASTHALEVLPGGQIHRGLFRGSAEEHLYASPPRNEAKMVTNPHSSNILSPAMTWSARDSTPNNAFQSGIVVCRLTSRFLPVPYKWYDIQVAENHNKNKHPLVK